jgi:glycerol-3-phosphate dehydrogenase
VVGVKYTTARGVAQAVVDRVFQFLGKPAPQSTSATLPLHGGQIGQFDAFLQAALQTWSPNLPQASLRRLIYNYGSAYPTVLTYLDPPIKTATAIGDDLAVLRAEVRYGVHEEMAQTLNDVVLRRGELGSAGQPDAKALKVCAETMAEELGWSLAKTQLELDQTHAYFAGRSPKGTLSVS